MQVEFACSGGKYQVTFHGQHPETKLEAIVEQFSDAGIKIHTNRIAKGWPEVATVPPTVKFMVFLDEYQYETMIRQAFTKEAAGPVEGESA